MILVDPCASSSSRRRGLLTVVVRQLPRDALGRRSMSLGIHLLRQPLLHLGGLLVRVGHAVHCSHVRTWEPVLGRVGGAVPQPAAPWSRGSVRWPCVLQPARGRDAVVTGR